MTRWELNCDNACRLVFVAYGSAISCEKRGLISRYYKTWLKPEVYGQRDLAMWRQREADWTSIWKKLIADSTRWEPAPDGRTSLQAQAPRWKTIFCYEFFFSAVFSSVNNEHLSSMQNKLNIGDLSSENISLVKPFALRQLFNFGSQFVSTKWTVF